MQLGMQAALWPSERQTLGSAEYRDMARDIRPGFLARLRALHIDPSLAEALMRAYLPLAAWIRQQKGEQSTFVLGINGAQGTGKSTLSACLRLILQEAYGYRVAAFSIDDLYKTHDERERLGREIHPLLVTRGVPGTHDVRLGLDVLDALTGGTNDAIALPSFDKARDDRRPRAEWPVVQGPVDIVLFDGWCVGAIAENNEALTQPVNELEAVDDANGAWRRYANEALKGEYAELFARLDRLIMLKVPNMTCVYEWRALQEDKLAKIAARTGQHRLMDSSGLKRFIMHYERLTRHMLAEMPDRADVVLCLDEHHQFTSIHINH